VIWQVIFSTAARRDFKNLDRQIRRRIAEKVDALGRDPLSSAHSKSLIGQGGLRSARVGDWRILFLAADGVLNVVRIGNRRDVYKNL